MRSLWGLLSQTADEVHGCRVASATPGRTTGVLHGSGDNEYNRRVLGALQAGLPRAEFRALEHWVRSFFGYQQTWLLDQSKFAITLKARQIGASHTYAGAAALWGLLGDGTSIVSRGEREANEVLEKAAAHCRALHALGSTRARVVSLNATTVKLASGASIVSLPSTSGARGRSANVLLDEAAYLPFAEETYDAASASVMHGFRLRIMSTPNGVGGFFHKAWTDPKAGAGFRKHAVPIDAARADGLRVADEECWRMAMGDPRRYDQLFRCSFLDGDAQYLPTPLIERSTTDESPPHEGEVFAGLDIGKSRDRTVLVLVVRDRGGVHWVMHVETRRQTTDDDVQQLAALAFSTGARRLCVDATGLGAFPAETMRRRWGRRVEPVAFTTSSKEDLATTLYQRLADDALRIPRAETMLRDDLCAIRRTVTSAGNVRYDAPATAEGHADSAWALALALHACAGPDRRRRVVGQQHDDEDDDE